MRYCLLTLLVVFFYGSSRGQAFSFVDYRTFPYDVKKEENKKTHCTATRVGEFVMIGGGAAIVAGLAGMASNSSTDTYRASTSVVFAGVSVALVGGFIYLLGKDVDDNHKHKRVSVIGGSRESGVVFNF
jgi:hypothetical protein